MRRRIRITEKNLSAEDARFLLDTQYRRLSKHITKIQSKCNHKFMTEILYFPEKHKRISCNFCEYTEKVFL